MSDTGAPLDADADADASPAGASARAWLVEPRARVRDGQLVISYAGGIVVLWCSLAVIGLILATVVGPARGDFSEARFFLIGLGSVCTFVAWFAVRPVIVADRSGIAVRPLFAGRELLRWDEIRGIGVRTTRRSRGRGASLEILATEDRDVKVDGLVVGATGSALRTMDAQLRAFAAGLDLLVPIPVLADEPDGWDEPAQN